MAKKLNSRGEELFITAFKLFKSKGKATERTDKVTIRTQKNGDFTIVTKNQCIQGIAKPVVIESFRKVYPYMIVVVYKKTSKSVFKCDWSTFELTSKITLVRRKK